jgi:5-methylcytosine-specific restriction endonuclease McrA
MCGRLGCERHSRSRWAAYKRRHPERAAFYASSIWTQMRARHLKANPYCVVCGQKATHADHIHSIALGGSQDGPLQSMCAEHHHQKTVQDSHEAMKRAAQRRQTQ